MEGLCRSRLWEGGTIESCSPCKLGKGRHDGVTWEARHWQAGGHQRGIRLFPTRFQAFDCRLRRRYGMLWKLLRCR